MQGSEKQIKWAENIKSKLSAEFADIKKQLEDTPIGAKVVEFIESIDSAKFWIDYREHTATELITKLQRGTLRTRGNGFSSTAKLEPELGIITITHDEIVSDGHGGHTETMTEVINLK